MHMRLDVTRSVAWLSLPLHLTYGLELALAGLGDCAAPLGKWIDLSLATAGSW